MTLDENRRRNKYRATENCLDLFINSGIANISFREVAAMSDLTERSLYRYFRDKDELIKGAFDIFRDRFRAALRSSIDLDEFENKTGIEQVETILSFYISFLDSRRDEIRYAIDTAVSIDLADDFPSFSNISKSEDDRDAILACAILKGKADGSISKNTNPQQIYLTICDLLIGPMMRSIISPLSVTLTDWESRTGMIIGMLRQ